MSEEEARDWIAVRFGPEAMDRLEQLAALVAEESRVQNLISASTLDQIWTRHILDSAQLVPLAPATGTWLDIGTGAGFPGMVVGVIRPECMILVEPRRRRAEFLQRCAECLDIASRVRVITAKVENVAEPADIVSARAVAPVENILQGTAQCAKVTTRWLLPRGRLEPGDLAQLRQRWRGVFHVEQSLTDAGSSILVADWVSRR